MEALNLFFWGNVFLDGIVDEHIVYAWLENNYDPISGIGESEFLEHNLIRFIEENLENINLRAGDNTANLCCNLFNLDPETNNNFSYMAPVGNSQNRNELFFLEMNDFIERLLLESNRPTAHLLAIINKDNDRDFARQQDAAYEISDAQFKESLQKIQEADVFFTSAYELRPEKYETTVGFLTNLREDTLTIFDGADYSWLGDFIEKSIEQGAKYHLFLIDEDLGTEKRKFFYDNADTRLFIQTRGKFGSSIYLGNQDNEETKYDIPVHLYDGELINGEKGNANGAGDAYLAGFSYVLLGWLKEFSKGSILKSLDSVIKSEGCIQEAGRFASYVAGEKCAYNVPKIPQDKMADMWINYKLAKNQIKFS